MNEQVGLVRTKVEIDGNLEINLPINNYQYRNDFINILLKINQN